MDLLAPYVAQRGYKVQQFDYASTGFALAIKVSDPFNRDLWRLGYNLAHDPRVQPGDAVVAHSLGCTIAYLAIDLFNAPFSEIVLVSPNLDTSVRFPRNGFLKRIAIWYGEHDTGPLTYARDAWGPFSKLNCQGGAGLTGMDPEVVDSDPRIVQRDKMRGFAHSAPSHNVFADWKDFAFFAPRIAADLTLAG